MWTYFQVSIFGFVHTPQVRMDLFLEKYTYNCSVYYKLFHTSFNISRKYLFSEFL